MSVDMMNETSARFNSGLFDCGGASPLDRNGIETALKAAVPGGSGIEPPLPAQEAY